MRKIEIAQLFGNSLDKDDYSTARMLLDNNCKYVVGNKVLIGPENITNSYENNMIEGRKKLDQLEWGQSKIEEISPNEFYIHFTDFLTHKKKKYIHRCKQKITIGSSDKIVQIEHVDDQEEQKRLNQYYESVGLK